MVYLKPLAPDDEAKITGGQKYHCFSRLRIALRPQTEELQQMCVSLVDGESVLIEMTVAYLGHLRTGIEDVKRGTGDYCVGPVKDKKKGLILGNRDKQSELFCFWPCFGHLWPV